MPINDGGMRMKIKVSSFGWVSFAMMVGVMGTALISPLYALYQAAWQLKTSEVSLIYVIYMAGVLCGLLFLGRLPDRFGFKRLMDIGLLLILLGSGISLVAWDLLSLCVGRFVVGVASSVITTSATLGMARLVSARLRPRLSMIIGITMACGFGLGPLVGGVMGQWAPLPLITAYVPPLLLCLLAFAVFLRLPLADDIAGARPGFRWRDVAPKLTWPEAGASFAFMLTSCLAFLPFAVFGLYASLAPLFLDKLIPWHGPVVSGMAVTVILFGSALTQIVCGRIAVHWCGFFGLLALVASNALLLVNVWNSSAIVFASGVILTAMGHGMCQLTGIGMVSRLATADTRAGLFSSYLVVGYVGTMLPIMGMGWIADHWGMEAALYTFCGSVMVIATVVAFLFQRHPRMRGQELS